MILLRLISWPYIRRHSVRSLLTVAGIVLGVAVFVGMHSANRAVAYGFQRTVDRVAGETQLQVTAGEAGFDEEVLERVQSLPEVRVAVPVIEAVVDTGLPGQGNLLILGVDMTGDRSLRDYDLESGDQAVIDDPLVFLAQPDSIMVTREFAARNRLAINTRIPLYTMDGVKQFTVRGIMRPGGLASAFGGSIAIMDIYAAQQVFGRGRMFDRIDVVVRDGTTVAECVAALRKLLGQGFTVEPPAERGEQFESIVRTYSMTANISSAFALVIGMFIIYNSFAIAVVQRRSEIGILRALGASRGQIRTLFLLESGLAGLVGAALGAAFGTVMARGMAGYISGLLEGVYGLAHHAEETSSDPQLISLAVAMGVATSIVAAWIPARNAARVDPVQALQKGKYQVISPGENRSRRRVAVVFAFASVLCLVLGTRIIVFYSGYLLAILSALLLTPQLALWLARLLRPMLRWLRPVEGALAADSLIQTPRRTSATVAALMLSLAQTIGLAGVGGASYNSIMEWLRTALNPDLFVTTSENLATRRYHFPASMGAELRRIEGIAEVQEVRSARVMFRGTPVLIVSADIASVAVRARREPVAGEAERMYRLTSAGRGVMISENFASLQKVGLDETLDIPTQNGVLQLPVVGIVMDWSDHQGTILIDRAVFRRYWHDTSVDIFRVYVQPGATDDDVRRRILDRFGSERRLFVMTNGDVRSYVTRLADQWMGLAYVQIAVAVLVAILGIVNTLTVSILDRRRELGVLQAVGGLRRQIRHTVWMEALSIGLIGCVLGLLLGAVNLYYVLEMTYRDIGGMRLAYEFPVSIALWLLPIILAAAFVSAMGPSESAVRGNLVEALEYE